MTASRPSASSSSPEDKLEIARALDDAGVDRIEAGFPRVSAEDAEAIRLIADAGLRAEVWGFSRAVPADVEALVELGVRAAVIESPISDSEAGRARRLARRRCSSGSRRPCRSRRSRGSPSPSSASSSTRADLEFFRRAYAAAVEAGASEVVAVDTIGDRDAEAAAYLVGARSEWLDVPVHWHGHNDFGLATAAAVGGRAGGRDVDPRHGERDGGAGRQREPARGRARARGALRHPDAPRPDEGARARRARPQKRSGYALEPWKPLTGENLFTRESGAVASQFHDPPSIEPYASELVGATRAIVLGKKSGLDSIRLKAEELGLDVPEERYAELLVAVKELGARKRRLVTDAEFRALAESAH